MENKGKRILIVLCALSLAALSGCSWFGGGSTTATHLDTVTETTFCKGIVICGIDMDGKTKKEALALLEKQVQDPAPFTVTLTMDDNAYTLTQDDFTFDSDYETAVQTAYDYLFSGSPAQHYLKKFFTAQGGEEKEFGASQTINTASVKARVKKLAAQLDKDPVEPTVVSYNKKKFTFSDGETGITIDQKKLVRDIEAALETSDNATVAIDYKVTKPERDSADFAGVMRKLGTFSTVSTNNENGNLNMALALNYVNGTVVGPGETFSFNGIVGNSTNGSRGFVPAGVIVNGKLEEDYGGGICQASTTIYGAAIRSNMTIVERHNHTWPSTYVPIGQDAAVDYWSQDFQFRNDTDYPLYIECAMEGTRLTATLYGYQSSDYDTIEITSEQTGTLDIPEPTFQKDTSLKKGSVETERTARAGQTATAQQIFYKDGEIVKTQELPSSYYPSVGAIYRYGPGTDLSKYQ